MFNLEIYEMILAFIGVFLVGIAILCVVAKSPSVSGKKIDHRKEFFRLVEAAREAEILEKKPVSYNVSGTWKGEGDGYFGIGRNLEIEINQDQSVLSGRIIDQFGYSVFRGFFVWPYLWFDFERHGTVFEFRGIIKELPDGAAINGRYRYFQEDADWSVKRLGAPKPLPQVVAPKETPAIEVKEEAPAAVTTGDTTDAKEEAVTEEVQAVPTGDGADKSAYQRGKGGKCPDCGNDFEEILSFCIYCGKKKE